MSCKLSGNNLKVLLLYVSDKVLSPCIAMGGCEFLLLD
jgi:hypothetical protein